MRKSSILTLLLLIVSVSAACIFGYQIYDSRDDVTLIENTISGDSSSTEGLTLTLTNTYKNRLFWKTTYDFQNTPKTEYTYSAKELYEENEYIYSYISMTSYPDFNMDDAISFDEYRTGVNLAGFELFNNLKPGESKSKEIYLKDYYEYYPISVTIDFPNVNNYLGDTFLVDESQMEPNTDHYVMVKLRDYFKIPILENECYEIQICKDENGNLAEHGIGLTANDSFQMNLSTVLTENACYFFFDAHTLEGNPVDTSLLPDGFGIFCLPYEAYRPGSMPYDLFDIKVDELDMVYPLDPEITIYHLEVDSTGSHLLLYTIENETYYLTVIDIKTMETLQKLALTGLSATERYSIYHEEETHTTLLFGYEKLGVLTRSEDGLYELEFTCDLPFDKSEYFNQKYMNFSYNGKQLAIGCVENSYNTADCDVYIAIFEDTGMTYLGKYENSLNTYAEINDSDYRCRPYGEDALQLTWTKY